MQIDTDHQFLPGFSKWPPPKPRRASFGAGERLCWTDADAGGSAPLESRAHDAATGRLPSGPALAEQHACCAASADWMRLLSLLLNGLIMIVINIITSGHCHSRLCWRRYLLLLRGRQLLGVVGAGLVGLAHAGVQVLRAELLAARQASLSFDARQISVCCSVCRLKLFMASDEFCSRRSWRGGISRPDRKVTTRARAPIFALQVSSQTQPLGRSRKSWSHFKNHLAPLGSARLG